MDRGNAPLRTARRPQRGGFVTIMMRGPGYEDPRVDSAAFFEHALQASFISPGLEATMPYGGPSTVIAAELQHTPALATCESETPGCWSLCALRASRPPPPARPPDVFGWPRNMVETQVLAMLLGSPACWASVVV